MSNGCDSRRRAAAAAICVVALGVFPALSVGGTRLPVTARILAKCSAATGSGILTFRIADLPGGSSLTATQTLVMKCSNGTVSTAAADDGGLHNVAGQMQMVHVADEAASLPYSITYSSDSGFKGAGFGAGAPSQTLTIKGIITPAQFRNAVAARDARGYSDTVTLTVNP